MGKPIIVSVLQADTKRSAETFLGVAHQALVGAIEHGP